MPNILILFAHPRFEQSRSNVALVRRIPTRPEITLHDLYELYPDFNIDIKREKGLLADNDLIIWHHPLYWYSCPPLLKQWIDLVLEFGWAYGPGGTALQGKAVFNTITSGGPREVYGPQGHHGHTVREFLLPFERSSRLCGMHYLPPFAVQGTHQLSDSELRGFGDQYAKLLAGFADGTIDFETVLDYEFLNDWMASRTQPRK